MGGNAPEAKMLVLLGGLTLYSACGPAEEAPASQTCDARNPDNIGKPLGQAVVPFELPTQLVVRRSGVDFLGKRLVHDLPTDVRGNGIQEELAAALAASRHRLKRLCAQGGAPFDHTLLVVVEPDLPVVALFPLLQTAQLEGHEDIKLVWLSGPPIAEPPP